MRISYALKSLLPLLILSVFACVVHAQYDSALDTYDPVIYPSSTMPDYDGDDFGGSAGNDDGAYAKSFANVHGTETNPLWIRNCTFHHAKILLRLLNCEFVVVEDCTFIDQFDDPTGPAQNTVFVVNCENVQFINCRFENVDRMINFNSCKKVLMTGCYSTGTVIDDGTAATGQVVAGHLRKAGIFLTGAGEGKSQTACENVIIQGNDLQGFRNGYVGGHMITSELMAGIYHRHIRIIGNYLTGNRQSFYKIGGVSVANGATGDMLANKSLQNYLIMSNRLADGGEFGLTNFRSRFGTIEYNVVRHIDATGVLAGYGARDIMIRYNMIQDVGMSYGDGVANVANIPGIRIYGHWLFDPDPKDDDCPESSAKRITVRDNTLWVSDDTIVANRSAPEFKIGILMSHKSETFLDANSFVDNSSQGTMGQEEWIITLGCHDPTVHYIGNHPSAGN